MMNKDMLKLLLVLLSGACVFVQLGWVRPESIRALARGDRRAAFRWDLFALGIAALSVACGVGVILLGVTK